MPPLDTGVPGLVLANTTQIYPEDRGTNYSVRLGTQAGAGLVTSGNRPGVRRSQTKTDEADPKTSSAVGADRRSAWPSVCFVLAFAFFGTPADIHVFEWVGYYFDRDPLGDLR